MHFSQKQILFLRVDIKFMTVGFMSKLCYGFEFFMFLRHLLLLLLEAWLADTKLIYIKAFRESDTFLLEMESFLVLYY